MQKLSNTSLKLPETDNAPVDSWHYVEFRDGKHDQNYVEWKYFNFNQKGLAGYIVYYILDPEHRTKIGGGRLLARMFRQDELLGSMRKIPISRIQFDALSAGIDMDGSKIVESDPHNYRITGVVGNLSWDLQYKQKALSIEAFANINPGLLRWEKANWFIKMPRAQVEGIIKINSKTVPINTIGYTDANWGEIMPLFSRFEWGQYSDEQLSFIFGAVYKLWKVQNTYFYLILGNQIFQLNKPRFAIKHKKWMEGGNSTLKVPSESEFIMRDEQFLIKFSSKLIHSDLMALKISALLPKPMISKQIVQYKGIIEKNGRPLYKFEGMGFKEWSTKSWKGSPIDF